MITNDEKKRLIKLVKKGEIEEAVELYLEFLESQNATKAVSKLILLSSNYQTLKSENLTGNLTKDEYRVESNKLNTKLLNYIRNPNYLLNEQGENVKKNTLIALLLIISTAIFAGYFFVIGEKEEDCSFVSNSEHRMQIYTFRKLNEPVNQMDWAWEEIALSEIEALKIKQQISLEPRISKKLGENITSDAAKVEADNCNIDLSIWGNYKYDADIQNIKDSAAVEIKIFYLSQTEASVEESSPNQQIPKGVNTSNKSEKMGVISIFDEGDFTSTIADIVLWSVGIFQYRDQKFDLALENFRQISPTEESSILDKELAIAECQLRRGNYGSSKRRYDRIIEQAKDLSTKEQISSFNNLAICEYYLGNAQKALRVIEEVQQLDQNDKIIINNYIIIKESLNNPIGVAEAEQEEEVQPATETGSEETSTDVLTNTTTQTDLATTSPQQSKDRKVIQSIATFNQAGLRLEEGFIVDWSAFVPPFVFDGITPEFLKQYSTQSFTVTEIDKNTSSSPAEVYKSNKFPTNWKYTNNNGDPLKAGLYEYKIIFRSSNDTKRISGTIDIR